MRISIAYLAAVLTAYVLAVLMYTQLNLASLVELGIEVTLADRLGAAGHDLLGMTPLYLPLIALTLLLAFIVTAIVLRWVPQLRTLGYLSSGFVGILVLDTLLTAATTMHPLAVTRTFVGLMSQCIAGAAGGYVFARLSARPLSD